MTRSTLGRGLGAVAIAFLLWGSATAQGVLTPEPPLYYPVATWPPGSEVWTGSVAGPYGRPGDGRFQLKRVTTLIPDGPIQMQKYLESVTVCIKRTKDGEFHGTISYHAGLRSFDLKVSGRIDEKGRATFTEEIDPKRVTPWHLGPWRFTGIMRPEIWEGEVAGGGFPIRLLSYPR